LQRLSIYAQELNEVLELAPDARAAWAPIYIMFEEEQRAVEGIGADLLSRITALAMKVGLIYALMRGHRSIFEEDLHAGVSVARYCSDVALRLPFSRIDTSRAARLDEKILGALDGIPVFASAIHEQLSGRIGAEELRRELTNLVGLGLLEEEKIIVRGRERVTYTKVRR
jgi:hypothetical protein